MAPPSLFVGTSRTSLYQHQQQSISPSGSSIASTISPTGISLATISEDEDTLFGSSTQRQHQTQTHSSDHQKPAQHRESEVTTSTSSTQPINNKFLKNDNNKVIISPKTFQYYEGIVNDKSTTTSQQAVILPIQIVQTLFSKPNHVFNHVLAPLVLEVFGAGGAMWGFSEIVTLRDPTNLVNNEFFRRIACWTAALFYGRFAIQIHQWSTQQQHQQQLSSNKITLWEAIPVKLVLEVFGGAGAIWGFSEVVLLRRSETQPTWHMITSGFAIMFSIRYLLILKDIYNDNNNVLVQQQKTQQQSSIYKVLSTFFDNHVPTWMPCPLNNISSNHHIKAIQTFFIKFILQVCGGGGAIWGFSEVVGFRTPDTTFGWRMVALVVATWLFVRLIHDTITTTTTWQQVKTNGEEDAGTSASTSDVETPTGTQTSHHHYFHLPKHLLNKTADHNPKQLREMNTFDNDDDDDERSLDRSQEHIPFIQPQTSYDAAESTSSWKNGSSSNNNSNKNNHLLRP